MAPQTVNVLLTSFPGLTLHSTLCLPMPVTATLDDMISHLALTTPLSSPLLHRLHYTTTTNKSLSVLDAAPLVSYLSASASDSDILPLRISAPLLGGKDPSPDDLTAQGAAQYTADNQAAVQNLAAGEQQPEAPGSDTSSEASWGNTGTLDAPDGGDGGGGDDAGGGGDDS